MTTAHKKENARLCGNYILDKDGQPVLCEDLMAWADWFMRNDDQRCVARTQCDNCCVSTTFLGIDHDFDGAGTPVLWETRIFGGPYHLAGERYTSLDDANVGHELWVLIARGETTPEAVLEMKRGLA